MTTTGNSVPDEAGVVKTYVREMLELNPMWQSHQILRRRREIFGVDRAAGPYQESLSVPAQRDTGKTTRLQTRARRSLQTLQEAFYQLPDDQLAAHLRVIRSDQLPQYATIAQRLSMAAEHRPTLLKIQRESDDPKFVYSLLQSLVAPAAEAATLKEQYIESLIHERRVKPALAAIARLAEQHPEIVALQSDWFELLLDPASQRQWSRQSTLGRTAKRLTGDPSATIVIGIMVTLGVIRAIGLVNDKQSPQRSPSRFQSTPPAVSSPAGTLPQPSIQSVRPSDSESAQPSSSAGSPGNVAESGTRIYEYVGPEMQSPLEGFRPRSVHPPAIPEHVLGLPPTRDSVADQPQIWQQVPSSRVPDFDIPRPSFSPPPMPSFRPSSPGGF